MKMLALLLALLAAVSAYNAVVMKCDLERSAAGQWHGYCRELQSCGGNCSETLDYWVARTVPIMTTTVFGLAQVRRHDL